MKHTRACQRAEINLAKRKWVGIAAQKLTELEKFVERYQFSVGLGDILFINNNWYITHAGLLRLAHRNIEISAGGRTTLEELARHTWNAKAVRSSAG